MSPCMSVNNGIEITAQCAIWPVLHQGSQLVARYKHWEKIQQIAQLTSILRRGVCHFIFYLIGNKCLGMTLRGAATSWGEQYKLLDPTYFNKGQGPL